MSFIRSEKFTRIVVTVNYSELKRKIKEKKTTSQVVQRKLSLIGSRSAQRLSDKKNNTYAKYRLTYVKL